MEVAAIAPPGRAGDRPGRRLPSRGRLDAAWRAVSRGRREVPEAELALRISEAGMSATATDGTLLIGEASVEEALASVRAVDLVVGAGDHLELRFDLPAAPLAEMEGMIEAEIALQTPFGAGEARWLWEAHERPGDAGWHVRAAVMLAALVDPALVLADLAGARIASLRCEREDGTVLTGRPGWAIGIPFSSGRVPSGLRLQAAALGAVTVLMAGLLILTEVQRAGLSAEASAARSDTASLRAAVSVERMLDAAHRISVARLALPGRLAHELPDAVWLERFSVDADGFSLTGQAPSATDVADRLAGIGGLADIRFASPVTRDNTQAVERFRIDGAIGGRR